MSILNILSVFFSVCLIVNGQQDSCRAVNGSKGRCVSIYSCQQLHNILSNPNRSAQEVELVKKSHCGFLGNDPAVCCPGQDTITKTQTSQCRTPEGKPGECIKLTSCPSLSKLLVQPVPPEKIQYVQNSRCNGPDPQSVCCGPVPDFNQVEVGNCKNKVSAFPPDPKTECCGVDSNNGNKIFGGEKTAIENYPWLAIIEYKKGTIIKTLCGGSLISGKYVLTAAHCVTGDVLNYGRPINVRLGEYDTTSEGPDCAPVAGGGVDCTGGIIRIAIEKMIPHPQYNPQSGQNRNDIALIRLATMAPFTYFIRPICLPTVDVTLRTDIFNLTAAGWGATSDRQSSSPVKLHVQLPFVKQSQCQQAYSVPQRSVTLWQGQLCAGGVKGKDSCKGDSGGPLMYENGFVYEAAGVVSFGPKPCGLENIPGVYTNVYEYNSWIRSTIAP